MSTASLTVEGASWGPGHDADILAPLSFHLPEKQVLGIAGANGAGKSTLLRLLYRYHKPRTGRILIGNDDLWKLGAKTAACRVAAVLQEQPTDFALSVRQIVSLGRTPHRRTFAGDGKRDTQICEQALEKLHLAALADRTLGTLSGGERQRVMVARALAQEPQILILDEPTNHLDIRHQLEILELIRTLGVTIVTSLHDLNMAADVCDHILLLAHGQSLAFGKPQQVLSCENINKAFGVFTQSCHLNHASKPHLTFHLSPTS